ncbi:MAG: acetylglutamate kinase [Acidobacteria bacterium]|nr:acetylglutamate kinase [Acidobacteriota bacterium]
MDRQTFPASPTDSDRLDLLRQAVPYIRRFQDKAFVVKLGGRVVEDMERLHDLSEEVALCHEVGIRLAVVHGGGLQATRLSEKLGIQPRIIQGRRVTDDAVLDIAKMVYAGKINIEILSCLRRRGVPSVGLSGVDGNIILAQRRAAQRLVDEQTGQEEWVDFGHVGDVVDVDVRLLELLLQNRYVPVIACLGADAEGNVYNINADTVASEIAVHLKAEKYINMTDVDGIYQDPARPETRISRLTASQAREQLQSKSLSAGMLPKVVSLLRVVEQGVRSAHVISGLKRNSLLSEVFTDSGVGTMIVRDD